MRPPKWTSVGVEAPKCGGLDLRALQRFGDDRRNRDEGQSRGPCVRRFVNLYCFSTLLSTLPASSIAAEQVVVGGLAPVTMHRNATSHGREREFTSLTLLPGRGLNTFQITANLPGKGETELLRSPSLQEASARMNGQGDDAFGNLSHAFGGAFLIPFTSRAGGQLSSDGKLVTVHWHGKDNAPPAASTRGSPIRRRTMRSAFGACHRRSRLCTCGRRRTTLSAPSRSNTTSWTRSGRSGRVWTRGW